VGLVLPFFRNIPNRRLLVVAALLMLVPIAIDAFRVLTDYRMTLLAPVQQAIDYLRTVCGITNESFPVWLIEQQHYSEILKFNFAGSMVRLQEFVEGCRVFKVLGLFLLGLYIGRNRIHTQFCEHAALLKNVRNWGFGIGLPLSVVYAWNAINAQPLGAVAHSALSALRVLPLSLAYTVTIYIWYTRCSNLRFFTMLAAPGRMALTSYIGQSAVGIVLFYGVGFELALIGLIYTEFISLGVFVLQVALSNLWLQYFQFGPLEWLWRMLTYRKYIVLKRQW
jgi:uncharacterized protein